jgi:DNA helicase-2/ATP-dependent DNA helicase PcrA
MSESTILDQLNPAQRDAVTYGDSPLLILAGAGSGKTRVITRRIAWLIETGAATPAECLAVTFTNKAAREMKERIRELTGDDADLVFTSTFHSACARWLRRYGREVGLEPSFSIYDVDDQKRAIKFVAQDMGMAWDRSAVNTWTRRINKVTNSAMTVHELQTEARGAEEERFVDLYDAYLQHLKRANACDFGHLISFVVQMLEKSEPLQETFRHRYTRVFIDEFQDTNIAQYRLLKALAPRDAAVTVVGDDDQSIYGWRGASVENMHRFQDDFENVETIILEQNYRSSQPILDIANDVIAPLPDRLEKRLFTKREDGSSPRAFVGANEREEAEFVARTIDEYQRNGVVDLDDIAIFYRTNAQSRNFEEALRKANIPHELVGSSGFFDRREVKDMLAWLRLAANPSDDVAFQRIVNVPPRGIGSATVDEFNARREYCKDNIQALSELIDNLPARIHGRTQEGLEDLKRILIKLQEMAQDRSADKLIEFVLHETNYLEWLYDKETDTFDERDRNISELLNVASERAGEEVDDELELTPLSYFLATVALQSNQDELDQASSGRVRLMTIHTAKGLEFPVVFVTGLEEDLLPLQRRDSPLTEHALAEERRLCYVAFTRAEDHLWLTAAQYRRSRGRAVSTEASRFLLDIDSDAISVSTESRSSELIWGGHRQRKSHAEPAVTWDEFDQRPAWERDSKSAAMVPDEGVLFDDSYFPTSSVDDAQRYVGRKARHKLFGVGEIKGADPTGDKVRLTIEFPEVGTKKVILKYVDLI